MPDACDVLNANDVFDVHNVIDVFASEDVTSAEPMSMSPEATGAGSGRSSAVRFAGAGSSPSTLGLFAIRCSYFSRQFVLDFISLLICSLLAL
jgi:hypothetical protein